MQVIRLLFRNRLIKKLFLFAGIVCGLSFLFSAHSVSAAETLYYADLSSRTTYFDNLYFSPDKTSDYEQELRASFQLEHNLEHIKNRAAFDVTQFLYLDNSQSNNTRYRLAYDFGYLGERNVFQASAYYSSDGSRAGQIQDDTLIIRPEDDYRKNTAFLNLLWSHSLSERFYVQTQTSLEHAEYNRDTQVDYDNYSLSSLLYYQVNPLLSVNGGIYSFRYTPEDNTPIDNNLFVGLVAGIDYQINEKWFFGGKTSQGQTQTAYRNFVGLDNSKSNTSLYELALRYEGYNNRFSIDASRNEEPSNNGDLRLVERTGFAYTHLLSERRSVTGSLYWRRSKNNLAIDDETIYYRGLRVAYNWELSEKISSNIFYNYQYRKNELDNADSNSVGFFISYRWQ